MQTKRPWCLGTRAQLLLRGLRYTSILPFTSIDGELTVDEAITLYELALALPHEHPVAVEIGGWQGKSSVCIARGLRRKNAPRLCCVDALRDVFEHNLRDAGVFDLVEIRQGPRHESAGDWRGAIDLLFLDGDGSYEGVARDVADWLPYVRPGGYLAMHDVVHPVHDGPRRVVDERILTDPLWVDRRCIDSLFVARRAAN